MLKLLIKTIGIPFYQQHAGLFLVIFYLLFGAVNGSALISFHTALLIGICASPLALGIFLLILTAYALKCYFFVKNRLNMAAYHFVKAVAVKPKAKQDQLWLKTYAFMLLPLLVYTALILFIAIRYQYWLSLITIIFALSLIGFVWLRLTFKNTNYNFKPTKSYINTNQVKIHQPLYLWPLFHLFQEQRLMLFVCKLVSLLVFKAMLWMFADVGNDLRVYLTALLAAVLSHAVLLNQLIKFEAFYMGFTRSLALKPLYKLGSWLLIFFLLLLPELALLSWITPFDVTHLAVAVLFCIATMLAIFTLAILLKANMEKYLMYLLFFFFVTMLAVLAGNYLWYSTLLVISSSAIYLSYTKKIDWKEMA